MDSITRRGTICPRAGIAQRGRHCTRNLPTVPWCISKYTIGKLPLCSCGNDCLCEYVWLSLYRCCIMCGFEINKVAVMT